MTGVDDRLPTVSICLPTYNRIRSLPEVLQAIREQTFQDYELIVGDDGSTDGTYEYLSSLQWPNFRVVRHARNLNLFGNLTSLFSLARGRYIAIHHDGDVCFAHALGSLVALLDANPSAGFAHSAYISIDSDDRERILPLEPERQLFLGDAVLPGEKLIEILCTRIHTPIAPSLSLWRRDVVERVGGYRPDWKLASDEDLYRRVATVAGVCFHSEPLFRMASRPPERKSALGGWRGWYTIYEFRRDTVLHYSGGSRWLRGWRMLRLVALKQVTLCTEALSRWLWDDMEGLRRAIQPESLPDLPSGRCPLRPWEKTLLRALIQILVWTRPIGRQAGRWRHGKPRG